MSSLDRGLRFPLAPAGRRYLYGWLAFTPLFIAWIPLTWVGGNITDRWLAGAIWFFGAFAVFLVLWTGAFIRGWRRRWDPDRNYIEIAADRLIIKCRGLGRRSLARSNVELAEPYDPKYWMSDWIGLAKPTVTIRLRRPSLTAMLLGGQPKTIRLPVAERDAFFAALHQT